MFTIIFTAELKKNLKSVAFYIFTAIMFYAAYLWSSNTDPNTIMMGMRFGKEWNNAAINIAKIFTNFSIISVLFTMLIVGRAVAKDFEANIHDFFFTTPMSKFAYLGGRFSGALIANILIFAGVVLGYIFGCLSIDDKYYGPFQLQAFIVPIFLILIPNLIFIGSIFFALATLSRRMIMTYIAGIAFLGIYGLLMGGLTAVDNETVKTLIDPFGILAINLQAKFWTVADMNANQMPINVVFILNRIIWLIISFALLFYTWKKFKFVSQLETKKKKNKGISTQIVETRKNIIQRIPISNIDESFTFQLQKCFRLVFLEFKRIVFHPAFLILTFFAISEIIANFLGNVMSDRSMVYPLTSEFLKYTDHLWTYMIPLTIFFGGVLVWRERDNSSNEFYDTLPVPNWMSYLSKLFTLMGIQFLFITLGMIGGIITQLSLGFTDINLGLYIKHIYGIDMLNYWFMAIIVLLIQNLTPNKYLGFFISALYFVLDIVIFMVLKFDHLLLRYGKIPNFTYSNMNGFGFNAETILWYTFYWAFLGVILILISTLLWRRNNETILKFRFKIAKQNITRFQKVSLGILIVLFISSGSFIFYNKYILNSYMSEKTYKNIKAQYEIKYSKYKDVTQPDISNIDLKIDIFPDKREALIRGYYLLKNNSDKNIDEICTNLWGGRLVDNIKKFEFSAPAELIYEGEEAGFKVFKLNKPLKPGEEIKLLFDYEILTNGFTDDNHPKDLIVGNGTCLMLSGGESPFFPIIGYNNLFILLDENDRRKYGLGELSAFPSLENADRKVPFINLDNIKFNAVISTSSDQTIVSNGELINKWTENNRNYFHYHSDITMQNELIFASGRYEVAKDKYQDINIEIYYDEKHPYNVQRMIDGIKRSFDFNTKNYCDFPFNNIRIVEIPDYLTGGSARSQPSIFIWREGSGFTANFNDPDVVDMMFGVCVHEMAHQWWGYVVTPAFAEGGFMLTETMAQYVMAMCNEEKFGVKMSRKYLKDEMERYLRRRKTDYEGERAMFRSLPVQDYLNYPKSSVVMYALHDYIGLDSLSSALSRLVNKYGSTVNYPLSVDFVNEIKKSTPDSLLYLVTDLFEKITLYENEIESAQYEIVSNDKYKVKINVKAKKFYADSIGTQTEQALNDYIYVGVLNKDKEEIYYKKHKFTQNKTEIEIIVNEKPYYAGIDPFVVLIDRDRENNLKEVEEI